MANRTERNLIRILIGTSLCLAVLTAAFAPVSALPAVAIGQLWVYRLEVALLVFYSFLLLITPAFAGLARGRLPIEISTRGAKFPVEVDHSAELDEAAIGRLEETIADLAQALADTQIETKRLSGITEIDSRQQGVGSDHD